MQPHFFSSQSSTNLDQQSFVNPKISSTSTAESYTGQYGYSEDIKGEDPDLIMRFNALGLNELDVDQPTENYGPKRHASELLHTRPLSKVRPKLSHGALIETGSFKVPRSPRSTFSSKEIDTSGVPSGYRPPILRNSSYFAPYTSYSSNNVTQFMGPIPMCTMAPYYVCQPEIVPIPMVYNYTSYYPEVQSKPEPRRYFSSKKQVFPLPQEQLTTHTESSERIIMLIREFERSGDYKKLVGEISNLAKVQSGSRFLQKEVEEASSEFFDFLLAEVSFVI